MTKTKSDPMPWQELLIWLVWLVLMVAGIAYFMPSDRNCVDVIRKNPALCRELGCGVVLQGSHATCVCLSPEKVKQ